MNYYDYHQFPYALCYNAEMDVSHVESSVQLIIIDDSSMKLLNENKQ